MPPFLTLDALSIATAAGRVLFSDLSLTVGRERIGVVGRNGVGKSTLLRAILGEVAPASGSLLVSGTVGVLRQALMADDGPAATALGIADALARLERIEGGGGGEADFAEADWTLPARLSDALARAGLDAIDLERPLAGFSGGERTRIAIARLLIDPPDLLLLDEPTNNLDRDGREAIARLLADWHGGALVVSHDRALLEGMDRIVALSASGAMIHGGGWSSYVAARDAVRRRAEADVSRAARDVRVAAREAQDARERQARRDGAGRSYAASGSAPKILLGRQRERAENSGGRGRIKAQQRTDEAAASLATARDRLEVVTPLTIDLPSCGLPANRLLLSFDDVSWGAGGRPVIEHVSFTLRGPERVSLTGRNGAGKTSIFRLAAGLIAPQYGRIYRPEEPLAILDQQVSLLDRGLTIVDNMRRRNPELTENEARAALARFAFRNVEAERPVAELSGGEALRAGLACVLSARLVPQLLLLDEPTNHLDMASVEVMEQALRAYDGAIFVISHDRYFLEAIGVTRAIAL
jgi:ATPase subunit of ABC transporter with duplicated ATPase domains